ncbi:aminopeptidase P family protein [Faecalicatena orotica]|uniref:aminopeptidase P family protein n=1 Tax=Faecalicatena orotica TaxID=1544 RepID=UPI003216DC59
MSGKEHVSALRDLMRQEHVDAVYIGTADPHQSEGVATHWRAMQWFSGFTGTTGYCVITLEKAAFWSDGRYAAQMERELDSSVFELCNTSVQGTPGWMEWLVKNVGAGSVLSMDGEVLSIADFRKCRDYLKQYDIRIRHEANYPGMLWTDRPDIPDAPVWELGLPYAGESRKDKISRVRSAISDRNADCYLGCCLDDVAWLTNLRGGDHPIYPIFHGYLLITPKEVCLCMDEEKLSTAIRAHLEEDGISIFPRNEVFPLISRLPSGSRILMDPYKTSLKLFASVPEDVHIIEQMDIITYLKSRKNPTEQENIRTSNLKESAAIVRFIRHIYDRLETGTVTEYDLVRDLEIFRRMDPDYLMPANLAIIAYGPNAALPHYRPTEEIHSEVKKEGMLLFDICAHYKTGTTDITRVIPTGPCTEEMRTDYTLALKSNIALATQRFVYGMTGDVLDGVSKAVQWNHSRHFGHGTGHGMGYLLYVHEGPGKIITEFAPPFPYARQVPLNTGMLFSDEPGVYKPGRHGVRLENNLLVQEDCENEFGRFLKFETVTFCPFERSLILTGLLTKEETAWVDHYHEETYHKLSPYLNEEEKIWLREKTQPLV